MDHRTNARSEPLHRFLAAALEAISARVAPDTPEAAVMRRVRPAIDGPANVTSRPQPARLPASDHLAPALHAAMHGPDDIRRLAAAIDGLAPDLCWRASSRADAAVDPAFAAGHANATILGPPEDHALEPRDDVWIGLTVMAPNVTYPDHAHPPEEVYLALSRGRWRQGKGAWREPGLGGIQYNPRAIVHAMQSTSAPFLAIWCLPFD